MQSDHPSDPHAAPAWLIGRWRLLRAEASLDFAPGVRMEFCGGGRLLYTIVVEGHAHVVRLIYRVDGDELELVAWAGPEQTQHTRIKIGEGICGLAAATGQTEIVPDVSESERFIACFPSTRSEIVVPILRAGEVIGEIDVDSDFLDAFDTRDVRLLEWTAAKLAALW